MLVRKIYFVNPNSWYFFHGNPYHLDDSGHHDMDSR